MTQEETDKLTEDATRMFPDLWKSLSAERLEMVHEAVVLALREVDASSFEAIAAFAIAMSTRAEQFEEVCARIGDTPETLAVLNAALFWEALQTIVQSERPTEH